MISIQWIGNIISVSKVAHVIMQSTLHITMLMLYYTLVGHILTKLKIMSKCRKYVFIGSITSKRFCVTDK